jgi:hypothetical protein
MKPWFLLLVAAVTLGGCASAAELAAADDNTCRGYGFIVGTDQYAQCRERQDVARKKADAEALADLSNRLAAANAALANTPPPASQQSLDCTTRSIGAGATHTTCY